MVGRSDKYLSSISISDTLFPLYFSILRQVCFLAFFDLRTPSFITIYIHKADCKVEFVKLFFYLKLTWLSHFLIFASLFYQSFVPILYGLVELKNYTATF